MKLTIDFEVNDKNGTPLAIGDVVEVTHTGERETIESFDLEAELYEFTCEAEGDSPKGRVHLVNFNGGGFADPMQCTKIEPTTAEHIEAVLSDTDLTDGEALDEILRIIGHERRG